MRGGGRINERFDQLQLHGDRERKAAANNSAKNVRYSDYSKYVQVLLARDDAIEYPPSSRTIFTHLPDLLPVVEEQYRHRQKRHTQES